MKTKYFTTFLAGIDPLICFAEIKADLLRNYKGIARIDKPSDPRKGFIFAHFLEEHDQLEFMKSGRVYVLGRELIAKPFLKGESLKSFQNIEGQKRLFIKDIPNHWKDSDLFEALSRYGPVSQAYVVFDRATNRSRQFGYAIACSVELARYLHCLGTIVTREAVLRVKQHTQGSSGIPESPHQLPQQASQENHQQAILQTLQPAESLS